MPYKFGTLVLLLYQYHHCDNVSLMPANNSIGVCCGTGLLVRCGTNDASEPFWCLLGPLWCLLAVVVLRMLERVRHRLLGQILCLCCHLSSMEFNLHCGANRSHTHAVSQILRLCCHLSSWDSTCIAEPIGAIPVQHVKSCACAAICPAWNTTCILAAACVA